MKLDRNKNNDGIGKYALIKMRAVKALDLEVRGKVETALEILGEHQVLDWGHDENDFFVMRLKDKYATGALIAYAGEIGNDIRWILGSHGKMTDPQVRSLLEYQAEILQLATLSSMNPARKTPD